MAFSVVATLSDIARQHIADGLMTGKSFQVSRFSVSDGGHSPGDPTVALTPDPTALTCPVSTTSFGPVAINGATLVSAFCPQFTCVLGLGDANGPISSLCLHAEFVYSPITDDPDMVPTVHSFLFAVANFPLKMKTPFDNFSFLCSISL